MIIYLDQNKWIDLAKAIVNPNKYPKYVKVANLVLEKTKNGEWIFPLSMIHVFETTLREDQNSRKKLVDIMIKVSNGYSIKSYLDIQKDEMKNIFLKILIPEKVKEINAVLKNPLVSIGAEKLSVWINSNLFPSDLKQDLINIISNKISDKDLYEIILDNYDKELATQFINDDQSIVESMENDRYNLLKLPISDQYNYFSANIFLGLLKHYNIIQELGVNNIEEIFPKSFLDNKNKMIDFLEGAPSLDIDTKLRYDILKDKERPIQKHDNRDINFLSTAIPYCNVVITERTWKHLVNKNKLKSHLQITKNNPQFKLN